MKLKTIALTSAAVLTAALALTFPSSAKLGDISGNVYATDIVTTINGIKVPSYNIGGETVIIAEDMMKYGAEVNYEDSLRTLILDFSGFGTETPASPGELFAPTSGAPIGSQIGFIYESDIVAYVEGLPADCYNLGGRLAIPLERLVKPMENSDGYSEYAMKGHYSNSARLLEIETIDKWDSYKGLSRLNEHLRSKNASLRIENDLITFEKSSIPYYNGYMSMDLSGAKPGAIKLSTAEGEITVGRYYDHHVANFYIYEEADGKREVTFETSSGIYYSLDYELILKYAELECPEYTYTREEVVEYYTSPMGFYGTVRERVDLDECTFLFISQGTPHGSAHLLLRITNDGKVEDYADRFESVSLYGTKTFDYVTVSEDKTKVTFSYDKYYVIDLITGEMSEK